jgi:membrane associated rhomboid family serine protease
VPARFARSPWGWSVLTLFTSQFLHGGVLHLAGNMLYLWIFGNNVEDHSGHVVFLPFYLGCGAAAGLTQVVMHPHSAVPTIGASGAIAGVLGAYFVLFPRARVHTLFFFGFFVRIVPVPARLWLVIWFAMQLAFALVSHGEEGGTAWFAHAGGFAFGLLAILLFSRPAAGQRHWSQFNGRNWLGMDG